MLLVRFVPMTKKKQFMHLRTFKEPVHTRSQTFFPCLFACLFARKISTYNEPAWGPTRPTRCKIGCLVVCMRCRATPPCMLMWWICWAMMFLRLACIRCVCQWCWRLYACWALFHVWARLFSQAVMKNSSSNLINYDMFLCLLCHGNWLQTDLTQWNCYRHVDK